MSSWHITWPGRARQWSQMTIEIFCRRLLSCMLAVLLLQEAFKKGQSMQLWFPSSFPLCDTVRVHESDPLSRIASAHDLKGHKMPPKLSLFSRWSREPSSASSSQSVSCCTDVDDIYKPTDSYLTLFLSHCVSDNFTINSRTFPFEKDLWMPFG